MYVAQPIEWTDRGVVMLDQRRLPAEEIHHTYTDYREVAKAIRDMVIRGAPAIGVAAAMGVALGVQKSHATSVDELQAEFAEISRTLAETRPTAVDLFWALQRMKTRFTEVPWLPKPRKCISKRRPPTKPSVVSARSSCPRKAK
jgi:methylthioribose-1-phosphate isomerase